VSKKRTYWAKMNMDEARESIEIMEDAEVGRWFRSWLVGAGGKEIPSDRLQSWSLEQRAGYAAGVLAFADAQAFSQKQRDRVRSRYTEKLPEVTVVPTVVDSGSYPVAEKLPTNNEQRTTNKEKQTKSKEAFAEIPQRLQTAEFVASWAAWLDERKSKRKPVTLRAQAIQLKTLSTAPNAAEAVRWIETSIASGWAGIFPAKPQAKAIIPMNPINDVSRFAEQFANGTFV